MQAHSRESRLKISTSADGISQFSQVAFIVTVATGARLKEDSHAVRKFQALSSLLE